MEECIQLLTSITDKAGADAAAPRVKELLTQHEKWYHEVAALSPGNDTEEKILSTHAYVCEIPTLMMELTDAVDEVLFSKQCYESEALKEVLGSF